VRCFVSCVIVLIEYFAKSLKIIKMVPFGSCLGMVSYSHSVVTITLYYIISEIKQDIGRKSLFFISLAFDAPVSGCRQNIAVNFGIKKLEWRGYPAVKKV